jgi:hypothetical protein
MSKKIANAESRIAVGIRQFFRARQAEDGLAMSHEASFICHGLERLLSGYLEGAPSWDSRKRWTDGMVGAKFQVESPKHMRVKGRMIWGYTADTAGPQWSESFQARLDLDSSTGELGGYEIMFCDQNELQTCPVTAGFYQELANSKGEIVFEPLPNSTSMVQSTVVAKTADGGWLYKFTKGQYKDHQ